MENIVLSVFGGLVGAYLLIIGGYYAPEVGLPKIDFATMLGSKITNEERLMWALGIPQVFANGIIFALIYSGFFYQVLPGAPWLKGVIYGVILWLFASLIVLPIIFHAGLFGLKHEKLVPLGALLLHVSYGLTLGLIYAP